VLAAGNCLQTMEMKHTWTSVREESFHGLLIRECVSVACQGHFWDKATVGFYCNVIVEDLNKGAIFRRVLNPTQCSVHDVGQYTIMYSTNCTVIGRLLLGHTTLYRSVAAQ